MNDVSLTMIETNPTAAVVMQVVSETDLIKFCSEILPEDSMSRLLVNEARFQLSRLLPALTSQRSEHTDVLEVGAGSCILSAYLASKGHCVTALEPMGPEFDFFAEVQNRMLDFCRRQGITLNLLRTTGEQLKLKNQFDVAFTMNALEHMRDPLLTLDNMVASLKPGGVVLAHCPNYTIPLEVHFNIFLVTRSKPVNEWLYRSKIKRYRPVWDELNFIRYIEVRRHLAKRGLEFTFNRAVMRDSVVRLVNDPIFAGRMPLLVRVVGAGLIFCRLLDALSLISPRLQTPMEVLIKRADVALDRTRGDNERTR
jgi:2-polyprenyl-3-methyl-5-hydroxy-6-metoxy-1,4-benzoquinol methylase